RERLRRAFAERMPELRVSFEPSDIVSRVMSFGSPTPIEVAVSGPNLAASREFAGKIAARLREIPSLRDVQIAQSLDFPTVDVQVNRERAGLLGVQMSDVTRSLVAATTSSRFTVPVYWADPGSGIAFSVQVQIPQTQTTSLEDLKNVPVGSGDGRSTLLRNVASITPGTAVGQYERYNMARVVSVTANLHGSSLGRAAEAVTAALAELGPPPPRTRVDLRGQVVPLQELLDGFRSGIVLAIVTIFLLLSANFQSLRLALAVVSTVPAVLAGVVLALWLTGTTLNLQSAIGAIMAVGVAVANAILLVTFAERARIAGADRSRAAVQGAQERLRAILMTSLAMTAGMIPLALGLGEGGDQTAPLGRAVVGGLVFATIATLFVLPAFFALLAPRQVRSASLDPEDPESHHHEPSLAAVHTGA
ncbi:MAG: efflux RND transporter permease subunit, partial [Verrucomicrobia bacterium]|nr:efflux RND transporter permease subunit [Verrucomicrobiota bacterium]